MKVRIACPPLVEIILLSQNSADTGLRIFYTLAHYGLANTRAAFTSGSSSYNYISAFGVHLFLSANADDVAKALDAGFASATILCGPSLTNPSSQLHIYFARSSLRKISQL